MKNRDDRDRILSILEEVPFVSNACKKANFSKATFYRWYKDNKDFRKAVDKAQEMGRKNLSDLGESVLVKKMKEGDMRAVRLFLEHNNQRYIPKRTWYVEPPKDKSKKDPYGPCGECGYVENYRPGSDPYFESINRALENYGIFDYAKQDLALREKYGAPAKDPEKDKED